MAEPPDPVEQGARPTPVTRFEQGRRRAAEDRVVHEEPLEIQLGGSPLAVVMRTPGHDAELALGFLVTERVVAAPEQVASGCGTTLQ